MKENQIQNYLRALERQLWLRGLSNAEAMVEIQSHLLDSVEANQQRGLSTEDAEAQAIERFGSVGVVVNTFERERKNIMQKVLLALAMLFGLFIAYVDSRPTWDDTGITAGAMLFSSALVTLLGYRRPWLVALAVGLWTPFYEMYQSHNFSLPSLILFPIVILLFTLVGAYGGWLVRLGIRKTFNLA